MQPKNWTTEFLHNQNISHPDGRSLYQYRVTDEEFESLKQVMKISSIFGLQSVSKKLPRWDAAFVIYAAEWWRRKYDGSSWSWKKVFSSFDADYQELNPFARNHVVETGLRYWKRKVRILNGQSRYLGTVAIEGGLPLNQLKGKGTGGWLGRVFKSAIPKYIRLQNSGVSATMIVSEYVDYFPQTYRNDQIYSILGDMVQTVAELKKEYQLDQRTNPMHWLDSHLPAWREKFPLPLDQDVSTALLSEMVYTAVKAQESIGAPFRAIRQLSDGYALQMTIELLSFVFLEDAFLGKSQESIPARMDVELLDHLGTTQNLGIAFKTNYQSKPAIKMNQSNFRLKGADVANGYSIRFKSLGEIICDIPLVGGEELDTEAPWLFTQQAEEWILEGVASASTRAPKVRISLPENFVYSLGDESSQLTEIITIHNRKLVEAEGVIVCKDNQENSFTIKTGQSGQNPVSYFLKGNVLNYQSYRVY
ncbi:MAG: STY4851/ECs_5259 family protein [Nitrospinales bacterium]